VVGGGVANRCPTGPNERQQVLFDFGLAEGLVNGDFERIRMGATESGWSFHGGDLQGAFGFDGDTHLILAAGDFARHNRFYLPADVAAIQLCRRVTVPSAEATLSLELTSEGFAARELLTVDQQRLAAAGDWGCLRAPVLADEIGNRVQIEVSVTNLGAPVVLVDDLRLVPAAVFADGFESGDTAAWTTSVP
jgi:hypothetical protein